LWNDEPVDLMLPLLSFDGDIDLSFVIDGTIQITQIREYYLILIELIDYTMKMDAASSKNS
jgi:hypothetical protein